MSGWPLGLGQVVVKVFSELFFHHFAISGRSSPPQVSVVIFELLSSLSHTIRHRFTVDVYFRVISHKPVL
jgi:hypothetical protein